jgi:hypothetical protein
MGLRGPKVRPFAERFWSRVRRSDDGACWDWLGAVMGKGYGVLKKPGERLNVSAHRAAYELANGPIPDRMHVLHRCDRPRCCNPAHLFIGTNADNVADMMAKGRHWAHQRPR